jgi:endonuclease/exonuclease/phosphatase family metal-dependent hydrolase
MAVLMFWNVGRRDNREAIGRLCRDHDVDLLLLAEAEAGPADMASGMNRLAGWDRGLWELPRRVSRVRAFTRYPPDHVRPAFDDPNVKILELRPPVGRPLPIVAVHLPSKLRAKEEDQAYRIRRLRADIEFQERQCGHQNTVVIGDLNVNPFEEALTAADGLHGVMDKKVAERPARTVRGSTWSYFYNPMWSRLGDDSVGPPGTHWYAGSGLVNHFWNTYDQVLLRPSLLPFFDPRQLLVLDRVGGDPVLPMEGGRTSLSDHLPLVLNLTIEKELGDG